MTHLILELYAHDLEKNHPALTATSSDECSIAYAAPHGAMTLGFCITRELSDFHYAELARLAYNAMRHSYDLIRFPHTIISIPDHEHTTSVSISHD